MKKIPVLFFFLFMALMPMNAHEKNKPIKFEYDVDFKYYFDNREFAYSEDRITPSSTINSVVLTPSVGFSVFQGEKATHRLMLGLDMVRDMGSGQTTNLFREITIFYNAQVKLKKGVFEGIAGVYPRRFMDGDYSEAFYSDSLKFFDRNLDGVLLKYRSDRFFAELGCDWMGKAGYDRKERFEIFSAGCWNATDWMALGWTVSMYHYAGSETAPGVVDNHKLNPYLSFSATKYLKIQELSLKAGAILTYQRDRVREKKAHFPSGGEAVLTLRNWNVCLQNTTYFGKNLLLYYNGLDTGGRKYGNDLYRGQPFYSGFYNRLDISWSPNITDWLGLCAGIRMHYTKDGFMGWQQRFGINLNLDALRNPWRKMEKGKKITIFD